MVIGVLSFSFLFFHFVHNLHHDLVLSGDACKECAGGACLLKAHKTVLLAPTGRDVCATTNNMNF